MGSGRRVLTVEVVTVVGGDGDGTDVVRERHGYVSAVCVAEFIVPDEPRSSAVLQEVRVFNANSSFGMHKFLVF